MRKPFQGVLNIVRFNWHYFVVSKGLLTLILFFANYYQTSLTIVINILCSLAFLSILVSLLVSFYVYDLSNLYKLDWIDSEDSKQKLSIININAGFDETHTEISIKRVRKAYPPFPNTKQIETSKLPLDNDSIDKFFLILSANEIRDSLERTLFFTELHRGLKNNREIILTEHLSDTSNFLVYNIGAFHFHSENAWLKNFRNAKLTIANKPKITPFLTTFILEKNGTSS